MVFLVSLVSLSPSCQRDQSDSDHLANTLKMFQKERVNLPSSLLLIKGTEKRFCSIDPDLPPLIYYYGPNDCSDCAVGHLYDKISLIETARREQSFQVVFLFSPKPEDIKYVIDHISQMQFDFPVYIDVESIMNQRVIPLDTRFHTFLLDQDQHPCMVGDPLTSEKMMRVFQRALSNLSTTEN